VIALISVLGMVRVRKTEVLSKLRKDWKWKAIRFLCLIVSAISIYGMWSEINKSKLISLSFQHLFIHPFRVEGDKWELSRVSDPFKNEKVLMVRVSKEDIDLDTAFEECHCVGLKPEGKVKADDIESIMFQISPSQFQFSPLVEKAIKDDLIRQLEEVSKKIEKLERIDLTLTKNYKLVEKIVTELKEGEYVDLNEVELHRYAYYRNPYDSSSLYIPTLPGDRFITSILPLPVWDFPSPYIWRKSGPEEWYLIMWNTLSVYGWITLVLGAIFGLIYFVGIRLFLFCFALKKSPLMTVKMIPYIWYSRQFNRSIFSPAELIPGYRFNKREILRILPANKDENYRAIFRAAAFSVVKSVCYVSNLLFKLSFPILLMVVYLSFPRSIKSSNIKKNIFLHKNSRLIALGLITSSLVLTLAFLKLVIYSNAAGISESFNLSNFNQIQNILTPRRFTLWQFASLISAMLFFLIIKEVDYFHYVLKNKLDVGGINSWRLRGLDFCMRLRALTAFYSLACVLIISFPLPRENLFWLANITLWSGN